MATDGWAVDHPLVPEVKGLLSAPSFYLSEYLENHWEPNTDHLLALSRDGDWTGWCRFFLRAIIEQAGTNQTKGAGDPLTRARTGWSMPQSQYGVRALDWFFSRPIFVASDFVAQVDMQHRRHAASCVWCVRNGLLRLGRKWPAACRACVP
ncbi:MAG: hypothetical protein R3D63_02780 [Paracoccaceae bacterium]